MATEVVMPRLSDTMDSGTIARWLKQEGDTIKRGDIIAEIETDKSNMELEAFAPGVLARIIVAEGQSAALGQPIAVIAADENEAQQLQSSAGTAAPAKSGTGAPEGEAAQAAPTQEPSSPDGRGAPEAVKQAPSQPAQAQPAAEVEPGARVKASPLARRLAEEHGVELGRVTGTGPGGRIIKEDVLAFLQRAPTEAPAQPAAAPPSAGGVPSGPPERPTPAISGAGVRGGEPLQLSRMQQTIARRMAESKFSAPEFLLTAEFDMTEARALLRSLAGVEGAPKIGPNDLLIKAVGVALRQHPEINSGWENGTIVRYSRVNVGNAVAIEGGLIVPVIQDADRKALGQIATESKALIDKARAGKLQPNEYEGGTFTVSNLGMFGIDEFTAILNPPEACILAVGAITAKPVVQDGEVMVRDRMRVTMSCDHRVINGAQGADFLRTLRRLLESPMLTII